MTSYQGKDTEGNAVFDNTVPMPTLTFNGTNAGVGYDPVTGEIWAQSRKNIINVEKDNMGWAFFVEKNKDLFLEIFTRYLPQTDGKTDIILFGEWCGSNIQKGVAVSELDKMFVCFEAMCGDTRLAVDLVDFPEDSIFPITAFPRYTVDIDFNNPALAINQMTEITEQVEAECPVGKHFGVSGIGEGVVCGATYQDKYLNFKVKGEKHSATKVKKLVKVDVEKIASVDKFVEYAVTDNRLNQAIEQVFTLENEEPTVKGLGKFLKWIMGDICKEEMDTLVENNLEPKDVSKAVNQKSREWFMNNH
jgi:hypothetical protein